MNIKFNVKYIWLAIGAVSMILLAFDWFGFGSENLKTVILVLNALMFILSVPCSLIFIPVAAAADYYLEMSPTSNQGIYLNTIFLFVLGLVQWFWIANFWSPTEQPFQQLDLLEGSSK
jgi:hypothetical protein